MIWTEDSVELTNDRMQKDLYTLCHINRVTRRETHELLDWMIPSMELVRDCEITADTIEWALNQAPLWYTPYDHVG